MEKLGIAFYGGEPLLNFGVLRHAIEYANERARRADLPTVSYHLSTNGTLVTDEIAAFLSDHDVNVLVSLDGPASVHDRVRVTRSGMGTHRHVRRGIRRLRAAGGRLKISASAVISRGRRLLDAYNYLSKRGFRDVKISYVRYLGDSDAALDAATTEQYVADLRTVALRYRDRLLAGERPEFYEFNRKILHLWTQTRRLEFCPAAQTRFGVDCDGRVFPCGPAACMDHRALGDVFTGVDEAAVAAFVEHNRSAFSESCGSCWARYLCGGGCPLPLVRRSQNACELSLLTARLAIFVYLAVRERDQFKLALLVDEGLPDLVARLASGGDA